jgi:hypothetical protein
LIARRIEGNGWEKTLEEVCEDIKGKVSANIEVNFVEISTRFQGGSFDAKLLKFV